MVDIILENEQDKEELTPEIEKAITDVCTAVLDSEECDFDAEISITLVDNEAIREINNEQRSIDKATDV
ncbi:MAG: rRNA maturation RNAse YbeY, partial [Clostridia bacterium]|nr:rRNA maturation RNAse YbeY [Clostridia bacterium]